MRSQKARATAYQNALLDHSRTYPLLDNLPSARGKRCLNGRKTVEFGETYVSLGIFIEISPSYHPDSVVSYNRLSRQDAHKKLMSLALRFKANRGANI
jgi:hypothetical protein